MGSVGIGCGNDDDTGSYPAPGAGAAAAGAGPRDAGAGLAGFSRFACCACTRHPAEALCWPPACGDVGEYAEGATSAALGGVEIVADDGAGGAPGEAAAPAGNADGGGRLGL
jgi:hypothetical protein